MTVFSAPAVNRVGDEILKILVRNGEIGEGTLYRKLGLTSRVGLVGPDEFREQLLALEARGDIVCVQASWKLAKDVPRRALFS